MSRQRETSQVRKSELTDAALRIVSTRGIAALTTRALAVEVGLSTGAIFKHFSSLELLLGSVVSRVEEVLDSTFPPPTMPPVERLERFVLARSTAVGSQLGILRLILSEQFVLALPESGSKRLQACVQKTRAFISKCIIEGQASGHLRADVSAKTLTPIVMGTVQMLALSSSKAPKRNAEARAVLGSLLTLLRSPDVDFPSHKRSSP